MNSDITVGVVRPIDEKVGFSSTHFSYVESRISTLVASCIDESHNFKFEGLVSEDKGVTNIQARIIQQILDTDFVVGIMSGLNPNVMFELGLRMSTRKPVIIIADNETVLPFDLSTFYIIRYPRDLNGPDMATFEKEFARKFLGTWDSFINNGPGSTFIAQFEPTSPTPSQNLQQTARDIEREMITNQKIRRRGGAGF